MNTFVAYYKLGTHQPTFRECVLMRHGPTETHGGSIREMRDFLHQPPSYILMAIAYGYLSTKGGEDYINKLALPYSVMVQTNN